MKRRTKQIRHKTSAARKTRPVPFYFFIIEFSSDIRIDAIPPVNESENLFPKRYRPDKLTVEQLFIRFAEFYDGRFACGDHDLFPRKRVYAVPFVLVSQIKGCKTGNVNVFPFFQRVGDRLEKGVEIGFGVLDRYAERVGVGSDEFTFVHKIPPWTVAGTSRHDIFGTGNRNGFTACPSAETFGKRI